MAGATQTVCFGDNLNDLPMFAFATRSYAVANADPEVRMAADAVIEANTRDGVARRMEENARFSESPQFPET